MNATHKLRTWPAVLCLCSVLIVLIGCNSSNTISGDKAQEGLELVFRGEPAKASVLLDEAISLNPNNATAWGAQGLRYLAQGKYSDAVDAFDRSTLLTGPTELTLQYRALAKLRLGALDEALADSKTATKIDNANGRAHAILGAIELEYGQNERALSSFDRAIELLDADTPLDRILNIDRAGIHNSRGTIFSRLKQGDEAITAYTTAIELSPSEAMFYMNRGAQYVQQGKLDEGIQDLTRAIEVEPTSATLHQLRGNAYLTIGRIDESRADFAKAKKLWDASSDSAIDSDIRSLLPPEEFEPGMPESDLGHH